MLCRSQAKKEAEAWSSGCADGPGQWGREGQGPYKGPEHCASACPFACVFLVC